MEELVYRSNQKKFWLIMAPVYLASSVVLLRFSGWGLKVFFPGADLPLRIFSGYLPPMVVLINFVLLVLVYRRYMGMRFQITPTNLVFIHRGRRYEFPWEEVRVVEEGKFARIRVRRKEVLVHRFFFPDLPRLCELVREAHRYKTRDWGIGPS